jgi:AcrR family transcriptional regulator
LAVVDGALACIARHGLRKTTVEDVAVASGLSRATLYRVFPGGRDAIVAAVAETELARYFSALAVAMGSASTLEDLLVAGIRESARRYLDSALITALLAEEPWTVLRHGSVGEMDRTLSTASSFAEPFFVRWLEPEQARRAVEFAARVVVSYLVDPDPVIELSDEAAVRSLVQRFVLPGVEALRGDELLG